MPAWSTLAEANTTNLCLYPACIAKGTWLRLAPPDAGSAAEASQEILTQQSDVNHFETAVNTQVDHELAEMDDEENDPKIEEEAKKEMSPEKEIELRLMEARTRVEETVQMVSSARTEIARSTNELQLVVDEEAAVISNPDTNSSQRASWARVHRGADASVERAKAHVVKCLKHVEVEASPILPSVSHASMFHLQMMAHC